MKALFTSSDKVHEPNKPNPIGQRKYPWREMNIGQSFAVGTTETKGATLKSHASKMGKKLGMKFKVIDHGEDGYEVARIG